MYPKVAKRDGRIVEFDSTKISNAIKAAFQATAYPANGEVDTVLKQVLLLMESKDLVTIEEIQDCVEKSLFEQRFFDVLRAYAVYRERRASQRNTSAALEFDKMVREYIERQDWRVNANANQDYSLGGLILNTAGKVIANYWLNSVYPNEVRESHINGDIHIHDLDILSGYCGGWSIREILMEGVNGGAGKVESGPPKHLESATSQIVNFLGILQNEWAGAQALSSFDTYLAPYVKMDRLDYYQVKQSIQQFVFNLNVPSRWGTQTPFTNITLDWVCPKDLEAQNAVIGGEFMSFAYGECQKEMDMINRALLEVYIAGDWKGRAFTFPIPTYNITDDFNWDSENCQLLFEMTSKYGTPYFQNFVYSDLNPSDVRSMCCRLRLDLRELRNRGNGLFGSAEKTGSIGVVTINLARLGFISTDRQDFFDRLERLMIVAKTSLELKRKQLTKNLKNGLYPYTDRYLGSFGNHFSTIGINGANECCLNLLGKDLGAPEGLEFARDIVIFMRNKISDFQEETGNLYNLEATPAEGATYRFAKEDKKRYPTIQQAGTPDAPYYTNSTQLPVNYTDDPIFALEHQEKLQTLYTGGTVFHLFIGERIEDWKVCRNLVKKIASSFKIPYFTITPTFSICPNHGYISGEVYSCPHCSEDCEVWSRVMGYHRPVRQWNIGKKAEYKKRKLFDISNKEGVKA